MKMSMYENLVMQTQMNYSRYYGTYAAGKTPVRLSDREALPYEKQIEKLIEKIKEADCIVVGGASGLSSAGGGDFYYEDTPSFRRYFGKFAEKYGFQGAAGNEGAFVAALNMNPMQIRIADAIARAADDKPDKKSRKAKETSTGPMIAYTEDGNIYMEPITKEVINDIRI